MENMTYTSGGIIATTTTPVRLMISKDLSESMAEASADDFDRITYAKVEKGQDGKPVEVPTIAISVKQDDATLAKYAEAIVRKASDEMGGNIFLTVEQFCSVQYGQKQESESFLEAFLDGEENNPVATGLPSRFTANIPLPPSVLARLDVPHRAALGLAPIADNVTPRSLGYLIRSYNVAGAYLSRRRTTDPMSLLTAGDVAYFDGLSSEKEEVAIRKFVSAHRNLWNDGTAITATDGSQVYSRTTFRLLGDERKKDPEARPVLYVDSTRDEAQQRAAKAEKATPITGALA
jgi:hypothetical protein